MTPRLPRLIVADSPHHIVQRGHRRQAIFSTDGDYEAYLADLFEKKVGLGVQVHAYCLMTNHVHLLLTPGPDARSIGRLMKEVARRATRRLNARLAWSGSLWESRYKSSVVQTEEYFLACCRYIERNPVRAGMVERCEDYRWSSYRSRIGLCQQGVVDMHPTYLAISASEPERRVAYRQYVDEEAPAEVALIRRGTREGRPTASDKFCAELQAALDRQVVPKPRGRPQKL